MPAPQPRRRRTWWIAGSAGAAVLIVVVAVVAGVAIGRSSGTGPVALIPATEAGPNPFTASAASESLPALSDSIAGKSAQLRTGMPVAEDTHIPVAQGTTPGLYGGSGERQVCDPEKLAGFLKANPAKAKAWAGVLGISPSTIETYLTTLTPVLLNNDTLVQNHGYRAGKSTSFPAVLQAGTAVLVDARGVPRVKCNCGNPLSEPTLVTPPTPSGAPWAGYSAGSVVAVRPGTASGTLSLVDVSSGTLYQQPTGASSSVWVATTYSSSAGIGLTDQSDVWTSRDGATWTRVSTVPGAFLVGLAWGAGRWVAVAQHGDSSAISSDIVTSSDLKTWTVATTVAGRLRSIAYGDGRFEAVGEPNGTEDYSQGLPAPSGTAIVYTSQDGIDWLEPSTVPTDGVDGFQSIAYGDGRWNAVAGNTMAAPTAVYGSRDGQTWTLSSSFPDQVGSDLAYGSGLWLLGADSDRPFDAQTNGPADNDVILDRTSNGTEWTTSTPAALRHQLVYALAFGGGRWLIGTEDATLPNPGNSVVTSRISASADGKAWSSTGRLEGPIAALAYGKAVLAAPPAAAGSTASATPGASGATPSATDCTADALQAALTTAGSTGTIGTGFLCSGSWATAPVIHTDTKSETTAVFEWTTGRWNVRDRTTVCSGGTLPPDIVQPACNSN
ncbi:DUF6777 domain-containing protein [Leifsonia sp. 2TAF2]|uniref:DUF6777 domain-containing protein n=1 Tax=Leifsonia sp. 2TAF2 TaxID=3233009 RepID=UPI003F97A484